jgi:hypothetical protein
MALLRPETLVRETIGAPRAVVSIFGIQKIKPVFWSKKAVVLRNQPYTVVNPHLGQMETRVHFAEIASKHKGAKGFIEGLPAVAYYVQKEMAGYKAPNALPKEAYIKQRGPHTAEELKAMIMARTR